MYRLAIAFLLVIMGAVAGVAQSETLAVIVNKDNPIEELSALELKKIFKADRQIWADSKQIVLAKMRGDEEGKFSQAVLDMSAKQFRKYWVKKIFRGEAKSIQAFKEAEELQQFVAKNRYAIGFISAAVLDSSVKAIRIDAKAFDAPGYILK